MEKVLRVFFSPAIILMNRMDYGRKLVLLGLMSLTAIAVVTYGLFTSLDQVINASRQELKGFVLIEPISRTVQLLQKHRGLSTGFLNGSETMQDELATKENNIAEMLRTLENKLPPTLTSSNDWRNIKTDWERLRKEGLNLTAADNFAAHTHLIGQMLVFEIAAADEYSLTMDAEIGSYYLTEAIIEKLPEVLEHLGQMRAFGVDILTKKQATEHKKMELHSLITELENALNSLSIDLNKATRQNPSTQDTLSAVQKDIADSARQIVGIVESDILTGQFSMSPVAFYSTATIVIDRGYEQMFNSLLPTTEYLINKRISRAENVLHTSIGIALLMLLTVAYFVIGIYYAAILNIRSLARSARAFANGDMHERIDLGTRDELAQVGRSFNEMATSFNAMLEARKQAEAALRSEHDKNETLLRTASDGIYIFDMDGNVVQVNDAFCRMLGYTQKELLGMNVAQWNVQWPKEELMARIAALNSSNPVFETRYRRRDGSIINVEISASKAMVGGKQLVYNSVRDITERKQVEGKLWEAMAAADAANRAKSDFLSNISHEIRTPMSAIIGLSQLCLQTELSAKQLDYLKKVHGSANSLLGIINDVLDLSKIEAGKMDMEHVPFYLNNVMGNLATIVSGKAHEKGLEFLIEIPPDITDHLMGDPLRLGQVLINLVGNAIKFTEKGEVAVLVGVEEETADHATLRFTVRDTGIGLTREQIGRLFQAFSQADASTTRKFGGTGLGLSISKCLVEMMHGKIWVESTPGEGSKFIFTARFLKPEKQTKKFYLPQTDLQGLRVLVADGNQGSRRLMERLLESFTFNVTTVADGVEALEAIQRTDMEGIPYDLVVADCKMPQLDGIELARKLKEMAELNKAPKILLISTFGQSKMLRHLEGQAVDGILSKPILQSDLFNAIMEVLGSDEATKKKVMLKPLFHPELVAKISGAHLLLVEDNKINQQVAQELLEKAGVTVTIAENGEEALALITQEEFDGVLMDMQMPVMDGLIATREIRKNPRFAKLPVIAMTANVLARDRELCLAAGMSDYIGKPLDPDKLVETLAKWITPARPVILPVAPKPEAAQNPEALPTLPGVKVAEGVRRMGGSVTSYCAILEKFRNGQQKVIAEIRSALAIDDWKKAERLAHTLKGLLGTLGAEKLQLKVRELETCIQEWGSTRVELLLPAVDSELVQLFAAIDHALKLRAAEKMEDVEIADAAGPANMEELISLIHKARSQLEEFDSSVEDTMARIRRVVGRDAAMKKALALIERCVSSYNYEQGLIELNGWAERLGISSEK